MATKRTKTTQPTPQTASPTPLPEGHKRVVTQIFCHPGGATAALDNYGHVWYWENSDGVIGWKPLAALPQVQLPGEVFES